LIPAISVILPVHNGGRYLAQSVQSILDQDWTDFELIAIDDGSTDGSSELLQNFSRGDARIRVIRQECAGIVGALNRGLVAAQAPLIARMDADDVAEPIRFSRQAAHLAEHLDCVAVGSRIELIDSEGWPICHMCTERTHEEIDAVNLRGGGAAINHPAVMFRTQSVRALGGYRQEFIYAEDLDLWLRLAEMGRLYNLQEVLLHYRMHAKSIGHSKAQLQHRQWRLAADEARRRRGQAADATVPVKENASSVADHHTRWAWWALMAGNVRTARKHALASLSRKPLSFESWKLAACAVRGH
jgi:glycosyltransferase involved in cell wall biosynthesis